MSTEIFPGPTDLPGVTFNIKRTPQFQTRIQVAISGAETRIADWSFPRYSYELQFEFLRNNATYQELQRLSAFFLARRGSFDSWLFDDVDDNTVTGQAIGIGDGATFDFPLVRSYGAPGHPAWLDTIGAPNVVSAVYLDGVVQTVTTDYTVSVWGDATPGVISFVSAPGGSVVITADFTFYWPCRFVDDLLDFEKFMSFLWKAQKVKFMTIKV